MPALARRAKRHPSTWLAECWELVDIAEQKPGGERPRGSLARCCQGAERRGEVGSQGDARRQALRKARTGGRHELPAASAIIRRICRPTWLASTADPHKEHTAARSPLDAYATLIPCPEDVVPWDALHDSLDPARGGAFQPDRRRGRGSRLPNQSSCQQALPQAQPTEQDRDEARRQPVMISPSTGSMRALRKRLQVEVFAALLAHLELPAGSRVVDFGCGSGALLLPLAALFPALHFVGVDAKLRCLQLLRKRAEAAGLSNVSSWCGWIQDYQGHFQAALALHACGPATDYALSQAWRQHAAFIVSPCCLGKVGLPDRRAAGPTALAPLEEKPHAPLPQTGCGVESRGGCEGGLHLPASKWLRCECGITAPEFAILARTADWSGYSAEAQEAELPQYCKAVVELDRCAAARERGYAIHLLRLPQAQAGAVGVSAVLAGSFQHDQLAGHVVPGCW